MPPREIPQTTPSAADAIVKILNDEIVAFDPWSKKRSRRITKGVAGTDDYSVISAGIASKATPTVHLCAGTYYLSQKLESAQNMCLRGDSLQNTILRPKAGYTDTHLIDSVDKFELCNIQLDGRADESYSVGGIYIHPFDSLPADLYWQIHNCRFYHMGLSSIFLNQVDEITINYNEFISNKCGALMPAIDANGGDVKSSAAKYVHFVHNQMTAENAVSQCVGFQATGGLTNAWIDGNNFEGHYFGICGIIGQYSNSTAGIVGIINNEFCKGTNGIYLWNSHKNQISNNRFYWLGRYGIMLTTDKDFIITNNIFGEGSVQYMDYAINVDSGNDYITIEGNSVSNTTLGFIRYADPLGLGSHSRLYETVSEFFTDLAEADADGVHAAVAGTGVLQTVTTNITNPDFPRTITVTSTGAHTGTCVITGLNAGGMLISSSVTIVAGGVVSTNYPFATITSFTVPATLDNTDTLTVGFGDKIGLSRMFLEAADVYEVRKNGSKITVPTASATYGTVDCSTITALDDFIIKYRAALNTYHTGF